MGLGKAARLFYDGRPREVALESLARQHGRKVSTVASYVKASAGRHRAGVCLVYGAECWALGGLRAIPRSVNDPRWTALLGRFPRRGEGWGVPGAPRAVRLVPI